MMPVLPFRPAHLRLPALFRRGAPLSEGWVNTKGGHSCVVCPYHGWAFDGTGSLQDVPVSPHFMLDALLLLAALTAMVDNHELLAVAALRPY
jgi:nitrite reductase/ring-hydroxylating ferredoxin subunit